MDAEYLTQQKSTVHELEQSFLRNQGRTTVVDMQQDYSGDPQRCLTALTFIPENVATEIIQQVCEPLKAIESSHYFYAPDSLHLTIKNIRTINNPPLFNTEDLEKVDKLFQEIVPKFQEFDFNVEDVLLFPTSVSVMAYASRELQKLVLALDKGLKDIGVPDNKTYFSDTVFWGNITVCRFTTPPSEAFIETVKRLRDLKLDTFKLSEVSLVTCNAVCHPSSRKIINTYKLRRS